MGVGILQPIIIILLSGVMLMILYKVSIFKHAAFKPAYDLLIEYKRIASVLAWFCLVTGIVNLVLCFK